MATRDDVYTAMRNADAAGDTASVQKLAAYLKTLPPDPAQTVTPSQATIDRVNNDAISQSAKDGPSFLGEVGRQVGNLVAGGVRGAGSIGATLLYPVDKATDLVMGDRSQSPSRNEERRQSMDSALSSLGADTTSPAYKVGKLTAEVAGTAGAGGAVANVAGRAAPALVTAAPNLIRAIETGGMSAKAAPSVAGAGNLITRAAGGAINGAASAGLVDPSQAGAGALIGGGLPVVTKTAGAAGNLIGSSVSNAATSTAKRLMQSAVKPTIAQLKSGDADTAVQTLLDYGISPNKAGVEKLRGLIDDKNTAIADAIANSGATIPKASVLSALQPVQQKFGNQVSPTADLASIQRVADDFSAHPNLPGTDIPVQAAQDLKQGTYRVLNGKFGQLGSAETEAQKGLARGLKEQIASAVPEVGPLNAEESRLITTLNVSERRALMEANKNPVGLAALAHNPIGWAAFMADKSAAFKALAARMVNATSGVPGAIQGALGNSGANLIGARTVPVLATDQ